VDSSDAVTALRLAASVALLGYASLLDWRTRRVGNAYWIALSAIGICLIPVQIAIDDQPLGYALVLIPVLAIFSDVYLDSGEDSRISRLAPVLKYSAAILSMIALGYFWIENAYFQNLVAVPALMLFIVLMYMLDMIRGGADAKALLALSVMFPFYPAIGNLPLIRLETSSAETLFPFTFAVLVTSAIIVALFPIGFAVKNLTAKEFKSPYGFLGYRKDLGTVSGKHLWLMEHVEDGNVKRHARPRHIEDLDREIELLKAAGVSRVWVTPKIPFIVPMTAALVFTVIVGNLLFLLFGV
jgi:preflagellin peptidase FlaK